MSLIELVGASIVGLMVLTVAYLVFETGMKGFKTVENDTQSSVAASFAVQQIGRPLRETSQFVTTDPYDIEFLSDWNDDRNLELIRYYVDSGSHDLYVQRSSAAGTGTVTTLVSNLVQNRAYGTPLFTYYESVGSLVSNPASRTTDTHIVRITVITSMNTSPTPPPYRLQTDVFLRNR